MTLKSVTSFLADLQNSGGPSSTNQYDLEFGGVSDILKARLVEYGIEQLSFNKLMVDLANEIQIPGTSLTSQDVKSVHKGINMKPAMAKVYNEMDMSFILDVSSEAYRLFRGWQDFIQGAEQGNFGKLQRALTQNYYSDYVADTIIKKYEKYPAAGSNSFKDDQYHVFTIKLINSYPYMMSSVPYSSSGSGVVKLSIGMYYEYAEYVPFAVPKVVQVEG